MSALDRELLVLRALMSCPGDEAKVGEAMAELATLRAELEQCRVDAERYQWLLKNCGFGIRKNQVTELSVMLDGMPNRIGELDAAIDAARGAK